MSDIATPPTDGKVVKRACTECRQQKARCDAFLNPDNPCTRCRKMHRQCVISEPFRREHKRKRLSELEHKTDELQERLRSSSQPDASGLPEPTWTAVNDLRSAAAESESRLASVAPFFRDATIAPTSFRSFSQAAESLQTPESLAHDHQPTTTLPRSIEGHSIDPKDIDAMFQLYFRDYANLMPVLDPSITPNGYYTLSPVLFWAIIGVGCRTYLRNPTLLSILPSKIINLALLSLNSNTTLPIVQGLLLLTYWPFPKSNSGNDLTYPLSGALLHMAMQMGLHLPGSSHEFSRVWIRLTEDELRRRAETWGYCMLVYQRSCSSKGSPPFPILDVPHDLEQRRALFQRISPRLQFELKLQDAVTRCCIAVAQNGLRTMTPDQERSLDTLLNVFQAQISSAGLQYSSEIEHLYVSLATLNVQSFSLYKSPTSQDPTSLYDLCASSCQVIELFDSLDKSGHLCLTAAGIFFNMSLIMPCHVLLRLLKTSFSHYIDVERAKAALFLGISLHKRMSLQNDDIPARNGVVLTQLWNSIRVFKKPNGAEAAALRVRGRLAGSVILDGIVWWREEFGGNMGIFPPPLPDNRTGEAAENEGSNESNNPAPNDNTTTNAKHDYFNFLDDPMLAEFGWPIGDDLFSTIWADGPVGSM